MARHYSRSLFVIGFAVLSVGFVSGQTPPAAHNAPAIVAVDKAVTHRIDPATLPKPNDTKSAFRPSKTVPQPAGAKLFLPKGFKLNVFAEGNFREPRWMA